MHWLLLLVGDWFVQLNLSIKYKLIFPDALSSRDKSSVENWKVCRVHVLDKRGVSFCESGSSRMRDSFELKLTSASSLTLYFWAIYAFIENWILLIPIKFRFRQCIYLVRIFLINQTLLFLHLAGIHSCLWLLKSFLIIYILYLRREIYHYPIRLDLIINIWWSIKITFLKFWLLLHHVVCHNWRVAPSFLSV